MKKILYIARLLPVLLCAVGLTSCDNDENTPAASQGNPVEFKAVIGDAPEANTRSTVDNSFEEGDEISIDILSEMAPKTYKYHNERFIAANPNNAWYHNYTEEGPISEVRAIYPATYSKVLILGGVNFYEVESNQTGDGYKDSDLLYAYSSIYNGGTLQFSHVMTKIVINIMDGGYTGTTEIGSVTLNELSQEMDISLGMGNNITINPLSENVDIQAHKSASPATGAVATFEALIIPGQTISSGTAFATIKVNDNYGDFIYSLGNDITFAQGTRYTFNLKLTSNKTVAVSSIEVDNWGDGGTDIPLVTE